MTSAPLRMLWIQSGGCGGCTLSLLCAERPDLERALALHGIEVLWHPALSEATGSEAAALLDGAARGETVVDILCVEGAVLRGPHGSGLFHRLGGVPARQRIERIARRARHVVAVGTCAAFGGISAAGANELEACGLQYEREEPGGLLGAGFRSRAGLPVINVAGCPTHPGWVLTTLALIARGELGAGDLDELGRPRFYAARLAHHGCDRNEFYEFKASAERPGQGGCLMEHLGCKGTQAHADCNLRLWNGEGSCTRGGYACIRCTEPDFADPGHGFLSTPKIAGIPVGLPLDMPKAWFVALASLAKAATPERIRVNAHADRVLVAPRTRPRAAPDGSAAKAPGGRRRR
ncbi:HupU protein [Inmirania thermothiophila]|uniref:hydrogenase (acceptor) n=1 Tax=Inmirania thermothiophila TaxID=1750597 RepID=A0A3N1Y4K1_9GAMM|nr:HupU protein [Inmirania thermothiophila]ROR32532.1 NiFe hydrogenase small subunit HydA [Inmirania thermothiophila]